MDKIVIYGAGGFGREIQWLIERINQKEPVWEILGYIDDGEAVGTEVDGYQVIGNGEYLLRTEEKLNVACAVGNAQIRKKMADKISANSNLIFPNLVDPSVIMSKRIEMGIGNLICASSILTVDIQIGNFNIINLDCTIGHDTRIESFVTVYPSVNISGSVTIRSVCEIGTGARIIQGKTIENKVIVGAGGTVVKDLDDEGTYVGTPVKRIGD